MSLLMLSVVDQLYETVHNVADDKHPQSELARYAVGLSALKYWQNAAIRKTNFQHPN